ncbi:GlsB/YeaQ/YmgE family stress response membrane protein [Antarcticirhabdus aurantiaca]|uniref:GlsB/YeaQ/YmgE family stress response membrane protein n=1 Tax=Antarcticirhabdus aurantiaca TaxID=2606717 RepID=A0ACD4NVW5_9HYPH|nr:GlsB/YeaQ/YmgE family stress response membrane protein [Antarcticirhabdus aurantiaca]WAJ30903.1 GlsB/YeaQ/YmgE family stress response membrane protein [Jeongeuplla avenae]
MDWNTNGVGWLGAIIIGGIAGWLAEQFMKSDMGVLMNIILGIVGAVLLNAILAAVAPNLIGIGWIAYLITGFIGACILIAIFRAFRGRRV